VKWGQNIGISRGLPSFFIQFLIGLVIGMVDLAFYFFTLLSHMPKNILLNYYELVFSGNFNCAFSNPFTFKPHSVNKLTN
jgi:hypothetical protein